jgi:hypothetical protein
MPLLKYLSIKIASEHLSSVLLNSVNVSLDTRYPTCLTCLNGSIVTGLPAGIETEVAAFQLSSPWQQKNLAGVEVNFYVDPPNMSLWDFNPNYNATTNGSCVVWLDYTFSTPGTHYVYATFDGWENILWQYNDTTHNQSYQYYYGDWYQPCNVSLVAVASVIPLGVEFSVSKENFVPGAQLTLSATVINLNDSQPYTAYSCDVNFIEINAYGAVTRSNVTGTNNGVAQWTISYPNDGVARAYEAVIVSTTGTPQNIVSNPVQLTVGKNTTLLLNVTRDFNSTRHVFTCTLMSESSLVTQQKTITLKLNSTVYSANTKNGVARFVLYLSPQANNNQTVFNIVASFAGDTASTATATMTTLNGTSYNVCTTTQYNTGTAVGYEPSSNSTAITVTPQTTIGATTLKSPEQMQAYAKSKGGLSVYPEFSWWYPWFRLHFKITISDPATIDAGVSLLPGGSTQSSLGLDIFSQLNTQFVESFVIEGGSLVVWYTLAKMGFWSAQPWVSLGAFIVEAGIDGAMLWSYWNSKGALLAFAIVNIIIGLFATQGNFAEAFLNLLNMVNTAVMAALMLMTTGMIATGGPFLPSPVNPIQVGLSFTFAAVALLHWAGLI